MTRPMRTPTLPPILTPKDWSRNKGLIAKVAGPTGIGAELTKLQTRWKAIPWSEVIVANAMGGGEQMTSVNLQKHFARAKKADPALQAARRQLQLIEAKAEDVAATWRASAKIPKSSTKHAQDLAEAAKTQYEQLDAIREEWKQRIAARKKAEAAGLADARRSLKPLLTRLRQEAAELRDDPLVSGYGIGDSTGFHQSVRGINAALARVALLRQWGEDHWSDLAQDSFLPKRDAQVKAKVETVLTKATELEKLIK